MQRGRPRPIRRGCLWLVAVPAIAICAAIGFVAMQGRRTPGGIPGYVALGSSYAAGAGLGRLQPGSPLLCARSVGGYPPRLARRVGLPTVDMSCGGATAAHVLYGGQFFQGPQIRVVDRRTKLVTITVGGNDVGFIGDLSMLALRRATGPTAWLARRLWNGPKPDEARGYAALEATLDTLIGAIRARAPAARVVLVTYPAVLPQRGTCPQLNLSAAEAERMRPVERQLAEVTRAAARKGGAMLVDMNALSAGHDACSAAPWVHGWAALLDAPFHPTAAGAKATADAIAARLTAAGTPPPA